MAISQAYRRGGRVRPGALTANAMHPGLKTMASGTAGKRGGKPPRTGPRHAAGKRTTSGCVGSGRATPVSQEGRVRRDAAARTRRDRTAHTCGGMARAVPRSAPDYLYRSKNAAARDYLPGAGGLPSCRARRGRDGFGAGAIFCCRPRHLSHPAVWDSRRSVGEKPRLAPWGIPHSPAAAPGACFTAATEGRHPRYREG